MKTILKCKCGHRIVGRDVLRTDLYVRNIAPNYVWIKYRCSRCKQIGETFIAEDNFDTAILGNDRREFNDNERDKFANLEAIETDELLDFRARLHKTKRVERSTFEASEE